MVAFAMNDDLSWNVSKRQICVIGADGNFQPVEGKMATVREDNDKVLGIVGDDYEVVANADLKKLVQPLIDEEVLTVSNMGYLNGGKKVFIQAQIAQDYRVVGEDYRGMITLLNSHDGTTTVSLGTTCVRVICSNTFTTAMKKLNEKFRHSEGVTERVLNSTAIVDYVDGAMRKYSEYAETLAAAPCSAAQFKQAVEAIYQKPADKLRDSFVSQLNNLFYNGKGNEGKSFYDAFNAVTEHATHYSRKSKDARMNYSQFGQGAATNRRAMAVLTEMATV
jgi:phage/plasmid-like protein (TIGR03299 family)